MKTDWQDDRGLSLTELMVVVVLLGVIIGAAWSVMFAVEVMSDTLTARAVATDEAQVFLDTIGKELRQA
ncbi:MAG: prepilin-type N-terminal cleavage/methylation domain-containing protein, partial [Actinomycetes bacterium]